MPEDDDQGPPAAIYVRISADREGRELGVQRQEHECRALAKRLGFSVTDIYSDNDLSASRRSKKPRPAYQEMLKAARAGRLSAVLAATSSRLTRQPRELEDWIDLAEEGVTVAFAMVGKVDLTTPRGRRHARDDAARDAEYADEISYLAKLERQQRREQGRWHGGNRPFGWERDGMTPRPLEQEMIRKASVDLLAGRPLAAIARDWTAQIGASPQGRPRWRPGSVRDVLINPRVAGMLPSEMPARWPAILDEPTWRGVVALLNDPSRRTEKRRDRLLTGVALCGIEGCPGYMHGGGDQNGRPTYRCSVRAHIDRLCEPVDDFVKRVALRWIARGGVAPAREAPDRGKLAVEKEVLLKRLDEATELGRRGELSLRVMQRITSGLEADIDEIEKRMAATAVRSALEGLPMDEDRLHELWDTWDVDRQRAVIQGTGMRIRVKPPGRGVKRFDPNTVQITWPKQSSQSSQSGMPADPN